MQIKQGENIINFNNDNIKNWSEFEIQAIIERLKKQHRAKKIINLVMRDRIMVEKYVNKSNEELLKELNTIKNYSGKVNFDRKFTKKKKTPFEFLD